MNEAKDRGKTCFQLYSSDLNQRTLDRLELEAFMREALVKNYFEVYYQPQIDADTSLPTHAEALLRLIHPQKGFISPLEFIPVAEDTGLIIDIGNWVLETVCKQIVIWNTTLETPISVSINVSGKQINHPDFLNTLNDILKETNVPTSLLEIELTESIIMDNADDNIQKLMSIKNLGIKLSIDDFGTGYSSLSYLKLFPIDTLKIDKSFINELETENDKIIVSAIAALARAMKLSVVVEGVETANQLQIVKELCGSTPLLIQGYYFSKPLPKEAFIEFLSRAEI